MYSGYILSTSIQTIETKFGLLSEAIIIEPNYNICAGQIALVITSEKPDEIQLYKFGLIPTAQNQK